MMLSVISCVLAWTSRVSPKTHRLILRLRLYDTAVRQMTQTRRYLDPVLQGPGPRPLLERDCDARPRLHRRMGHETHEAPRGEGVLRGLHNIFVIALISNVMHANRLIAGSRTSAGFAQPPIMAETHAPKIISDN